MYYENYCEVDGKYYTIQFPFEWILAELNEPICLACAEQASYNGVRIGYCVMCSEKWSKENEKIKEEYTGLLKSGGGGFMHGEERYPDDLNSTSNTYLKDVIINTVGDKVRFGDTEQILKEKYAKWEEEMMAEEENEAKRYAPEYRFGREIKEDPDYGYGSNQNGGYDSY